MSTIYEQMTAQQSQPSQPSPKETAMQLFFDRLIGNIEAEFANAGHQVDQGFHNILTGHLTIANVLSHIAADAKAIDANPAVQAVLDLVPGAEPIAATAIAALSQLAAVQQAQQTQA